MTNLQASPVSQYRSWFTKKYYYFQKYTNLMRNRTRKWAITDEELELVKIEIKNQKVIIMMSGPNP
jgi:hypothetical protein